MRNLKKFRGLRPVEEELRLQSWKVPHSIAYPVEDIAERLLEIVKGRFEGELIRDDYDVYLEGARCKLPTNARMPIRAQDLRRLAIDRYQFLREFSRDRNIIISRTEAEKLENVKA
jgi:hypothetical protein